MNKEVKISVAIPTYNRDEVLPRAINSVINQTYINWELIIVDDGSTDKTKKLVQKNYLHDPRINFVERPTFRPKGANACRNIGIEYAMGKYIAFLDSDDEWTEEHLENCFRLSQKVKNFYGCYSGAVIKRGKYAFKRQSRSIDTGESHVDFLLGGGFSPTPSFFISKKSALNIKFDENLQNHQDWDFFIRFGKKYSWTFKKTVDVIINWDIDVNTKKIDFTSCISFYKKNRERIQQEQNKQKYLYSMYKRAVIRKVDWAANFYKKEIDKTGRRNYFPTKYPLLFRKYELLKSKLHIHRVKQVARYYLRLMLG